MSFFFWKICLPAEWRRKPGLWRRIPERRRNPGLPEWLRNPALWRRNPGLWWMIPESEGIYFPFCHVTNFGGKYGERKDKKKKRNKREKEAKKEKNERK